MNRMHNFIKHSHYTFKKNIPMFVQELLKVEGYCVLLYGQEVKFIRLWLTLHLLVFFSISCLYMKD